MVCHQGPDCSEDPPCWHHCVYENASNEIAGEDTDRDRRHMAQPVQDSACDHAQVDKGRGHRKRAYERGDVGSAVEDAPDMAGSECEYACKHYAYGSGQAKCFAQQFENSVSPP